MNLPGQWWRRSIGRQIILLFLPLLLAVQLISFIATRASLSDHAHRVLPVKLREGEQLLQTLLDRKAQALVDGARLMAADYGFREAVASNDADTIVSVLANHGERIGATEAALLTTDFQLRSTTASHPQALMPLARRLSTQAMATGQASAVALLAGRPFQAVVVPVRAPLVIGWVLMAFPLDVQLVSDLQSLSGLDVTVLARTAPEAPWTVSLTSLGSAAADALAQGRWSAAGRGTGMDAVVAQGEELGVRAKALSAEDRNADAASVVALVSISVDEAVRVPRDLQLALITITLLAIAVFAVGSVLTARRVTTPLRGLAAAAERLGAGDFETPMQGTQRRDEVGELSQTFERMRQRVAEHQAQILDLAYRDSLTGLPNRARFREAVNHAISQARAGSSVAVVMLDLNRFKHVNDVLGYRVGDLLLVGVAERLQRQIVREGDLVARLGGDEFGILLRDGDVARAQAVAERIEHAFIAPLALDTHQVDMGASVGIACWPQHADNGDTLLNRAEVAMYTSKRRDNVALTYDPSIDVASAQTLTLMTELRHAVDCGELRLYLQPKIAVDDGKLVGAEALVRWQHPTRGLVPPSEFIPFAEQTGFIRTLTLWVFEEAARQWQSLHDEGLELVLSVNLSTRDLLDPALPQKLQTLLIKHHAPAGAFCLEITESSIMDDPQRSLAILERLHAAGFKLSIDDFGTGYSSLAYLKRLPVDELKIDQSFVRTMQTDPDDAMIVRSTIELAHNLGLTVVAEGVESAQVWDMLRQLDCDHAQGFHMGRPMVLADVPAWSVVWNARQRPRSRDSAFMLLH
jgi:diguanylate cyclase (GGDEF)-like protein